jgi:hypothetical protein
MVKMLSIILIYGYTRLAIELTLAYYSNGIDNKMIA